MSRFVSSSAWFLVVLLTLAIGLGGPGPVRAQATDDPAATGTEQPLTGKERRAQAKQARIDRYLEKKEAKRARKATEQAEKEAASVEAAALGQAQAGAQAAPEAVAASTTAAPVAAATAETTSSTSRSAWGRRKAAQAAPEGTASPAPSAVAATALPKHLAETQARLRQGPIGEDPDAVVFLDRIDAGTATTTDFGEMGNLLARRGYLGDAIDYYRAALDRDPTNQSLLLNLGSVHLGREELGAAERAFGQLLSIDPNHAFAHYNLGAVHQAAGNYDGAIREFAIALVLDPALGDPSVNPQAAINDLMIPVKLMLYERQLGSKSLPLQDIQHRAGSVE